MERGAAIIPVTIKILPGTGMLNKGQKIKFKIEKADNGHSLNHFLERHAAWFKGHAVQSWLEQGLFFVGDKTVAGDRFLSSGEVLELERPPWEEPEVDDQIPILFQSPSLMVVDKPAGMPTTPTGTFYKNSLIHILRDRFHQPHLVPLHRLDLETSGVLALSSDPTARDHFQRQFRLNTAVKGYVAMVYGHLDPQCSLIDFPLGKHDRIYTRFVNQPHGKPAKTEVTGVTHWRDFSEVALKPITGRTNQIRAHLAGVGHAIVGDKKYLGDGSIFLDWLERRSMDRLRDQLFLDHQALHCQFLGLEVDGQTQFFRSQRDAPAYWRNQISQQLDAL